jgi:uncharacterized protein
VIVDFHTHIFPPEVIAQRDAYLAEDATFRELYANPKAKLASDADLIASMDEAGIDISVALGFAWRDADLCRQHNDTLLEAGRRSESRIVPFCTLPLGAGIDAIEAEMRLCVAAGAKGFGELRPENLGFDLTGDEGKHLGRLAHELNAVLLFHVSEPVGHQYAGKQGLSLEPLFRFILEHPDVPIVAAHWGGGLPFYALMPEVKLALQNTKFDTAASSLLYTPDVYRTVAELTGPESIVFGSDFPLLSQTRSLERVREYGLAGEAEDLILGDNALRLLGLDNREDGQGRSTSRMATKEAVE